MTRPMSLNSLLHDLPIALPRGDARTMITDVHDDSRLVTPGSLFIARPGTQADGRSYIDDAIQAGASAVLTDQPVSTPNHVALMTTSEPGRVGASIAERLHGNPSRHVDLIGVTGTNGKTTVAHLIHHVLNHAGTRCGLIGTIEIDTGAHRTRAALTTPSAVESSRLLAHMIDADCRACVMETSSHALDQGRTAALNFTGGIFTNLSGDHLDYHRDMDAYAAAKSILFQQIGPGGWAVCNVDDPATQRIVASVGRRIGCSFHSDDDVACHVDVIDESLHGITIQLHGEAFETIADKQIHLQLIGRHNAMNALQAAAACAQLGVPAEAIMEGLRTASTPRGRLEPVRERADQEIAVFVDFAHTDAALDSALAAVRPLVLHGARLHVVFGCGGDRDRTKRPRMASAACRYAEVVYITSDNPRGEDPEVIIDEIMAGVPEAYEVVCRQPDRAAAIERAIHDAQRGDVVVIAGKGHETEQIIGETRDRFDDREVAAEALCRRAAGGCAA